MNDSNAVSIQCICNSGAKVKREAEVIIEKLTSNYSRDLNLKYSIVRCNHCRVLQTYPMPSSTQLSDIYSKSYSYEFHDAVYWEKKLRAKKILKVLKLSGGSDCGIKILDLGAGSGVLVEQALQEGWGAIGVEPHRRAGNTLSAQHKSKIVEMTAEEYVKNASKIDSHVVLSHTLEHLSEPKRLLEELYSKMHEEMFLVIVVPNAVSKTNKVRHSSWGYWQVPIHLYHFEACSITNILSEIGFSQIKISKKSSDFLSLGLRALNLLNKKSIKRKSKIMHYVIMILSVAYHLLYHFGNSDLIVIAKRT